VNLPDVLKSIAATVSKPFSSDKFRTISEESIRAQIEDTEWALSIADAAIISLSEKQFNQMYAKVQNQIKMNTTVNRALGKRAVDFISKIDKNLKGKAKSIGLYKAITYTSKVMGEMLKKLQDNVPMVLNGSKGVVMNDLTLSHSIFFGALESAKIFSSANGYMIAVFSHIMSMSRSGADTLPKYMADYLSDNGTAYIDVINQMCNSGEDVIEKIVVIKKQGSDLKFASDETAHKGVAPLLALPAITTVLTSVWFYIGLFLTAFLSRNAISEKYIDIRHSHYEQLKERKKWLEGHVAIIKLDLEESLPDDPETLKTQKIVAYYDDEISNIDKRLESYNNE